MQATVWCRDGVPHWPASTASLARSRLTRLTSSGP